MGVGFTLKNVHPEIVSKCNKKKDVYAWWCAHFLTHGKGLALSQLIP